MMLFVVSLPLGWWSFAIPFFSACISKSAAAAPASG
jgi:hypothetical protein